MKTVDIVKSCIIKDMKRNASDIIQQIKPVKSAQKYDSAWKDFKQFTKLEDQCPSEDNFIEYFDYLKNSKKLASSTMWSIYSMLNTNFQLMSGKKLQIYPRLQMLLKLPIFLQRNKFNK